jgi:hypothetical protein
MSLESTRRIKRPSLLPCPFCGGKAVIRRRAIGFGTVVVVVGCGRVRCPIYPETMPCDVKGRLLGLAGAAAAWNHRPTK